MKIYAVVSLFFVILAASTPSTAYQVWTSMAKVERDVHDNLDKWAVMGSRIQGMNTNFAPVRGQPLLGARRWRDVVVHMENGFRTTFQPFEHQERYISVDVAEEFIMPRIERARSWGYTLKYFMVYDFRSSDKPRASFWSEEEVNNLRRALDKNGYSDIGILYNARSYRAAASKLLWNNIDGSVNEGAVHKWENNDAQRHQLLQYIADHPILSKKLFVLQIPIHHEFDNNAYERVRGFVRYLSRDILGSTDFLRRDNVVILPMSYNAYPNSFPYYPDLRNEGNRYGDSMAGLLLSLIEQRDLFTAPDNFASDALIASRLRRGASFEAEHMDTSSETSLRSDRPGYTGSGFIRLQGRNQWAEVAGLSVAPRDGDLLTIVYQNPSRAKRRLDLIVNDEHITYVDFPQTIGDDDWNSLSITIDRDFSRGISNTLRLQTRTPFGSPLIDSIKLERRLN